MQFESENFVDEPVTRSRSARVWEEAQENETIWPKRKSEKPRNPKSSQIVEGDLDKSVDPAPVAAAKAQPSKRGTWPILRRGHALSFVGLLLFTAVVYFRPYELVPALSGFTSMAFWLAVATLAIFIPAQLSVEGVLTARPREVNLAVVLLLLGLFSVPLALDSREAWVNFLDFSKVIIMFVVMVNVVRTERRLRLMVWLSLLVGIVLSVYAINDYRLGHFDPRGNRIAGVLRQGLFENPNDMALHLVTMIPIALGLLFVAYRFSRKLFYGLVAVLMLATTLLTFSRGGFVALVGVTFVVAWKLGRRHRLIAIVLFLVVGVGFFILMPPEFSDRLLSIFGGGGDGGSAETRQNLLLRSLEVTRNNPIFGIGMGNFHIVSIHEQVSHNAYTQISAEIGIPALIIYVIFMWSALRRMRKIERETYESRSSTPIYYLAIGMQAALVGYMISSFFASVAYLWYIYYLVGYALCLHRLYETKGAEGIFKRPTVTKPYSVLNDPSKGLAAPLTGSLAMSRER